MSRILSEDEVNDILYGLSSGIINNDPNNQLSKLKKLFSIHSQLATNLTNRLSNIFGTKVEITPISVDIEDFSKFKYSLSIPTAISVSTYYPMGCCYLTSMDSKSVYMFQNLTMGGNCSNISIEARNYTGLENIVIKNVLGIIDRTYQDTMERFIKYVNFKRVSYKDQPDQIEFVNDKEEVLIFIFEIECENSIGEIKLVIPHKYIEPIASYFSESGYYQIIIQGSKPINPTLRETYRKYIDKLTVFEFKNRLSKYINRCNTDYLSELLKDETIQTLAALCLYLSNDNMKLVLELLPVDKSKEVRKIIPDLVKSGYNIDSIIESYYAMYFYCISIKHGVKKDLIDRLYDKFNSLINFNKLIK